VFGDVGPQLVAAGAIDLTKFTRLYQQQNQPLTDDQKTILSKGTMADLVFTPANAYFMLNFLWALGLTNQNTILTEGQMMSGGEDKVGGFASTGGWTLCQSDNGAASKIASLLTSSKPGAGSGLAVLPCCNNPTTRLQSWHGNAGIVGAHGFAGRLHS
jgi:hypothetical protein